MQAQVTIRPTHADLRRTYGEFTVELTIPGINLRDLMLAAHHSGAFGWGDFDTGEWGQGDAGDNQPLGTWWYGEFFGARAHRGCGQSVGIDLEAGVIRFYATAKAEGLDALDHTTDPTELSLQDRLDIAEVVRFLLALDTAGFCAEEWERNAQRAAGTEPGVVYQ